MMLRVAGIDPGLNGGLALISPDGVLCEPMPVLEMKKKKKGVVRVLDGHALTRWFKVHAIDQVFIEQPGYRPGQSVQSGVTVGTNFGIIQGILIALAIPYQIVTPQVWMKSQHAGVGAELDSKSRSIIAATRLFPSVDFRASERSKKVHDGMAEAALIAAWGQKQGISTQ